MQKPAVAIAPKTAVKNVIINPMPISGSPPSHARALVPPKMAPQIAAASNSLSFHASPAGSMLISPQDSIQFKPTASASQQLRSSSSPSFSFQPFRRPNIAIAAQQTPSNMRAFQSFSNSMQSAQQSATSVQFEPSASALVQLRPVRAPPLVAPLHKQQAAAVVPSTARPSQEKASAQTSDSRQGTPGGESLRWSFGRSSASSTPVHQLLFTNAPLTGEPSPTTDYDAGDEKRSWQSGTLVVKPQKKHSSRRQLSESSSSDSSSSDSSSSESMSTGSGKAVRKISKKQISNEKLRQKSPRDDVARTHAKYSNQSKKKIAFAPHPQVAEHQQHQKFLKNIKPPTALKRLTHDHVQCDSKANGALSSKLGTAFSGQRTHSAPPPLSSKVFHKINVTESKTRPNNVASPLSSSSNTLSSSADLDSSYSATREGGSNKVIQQLLLQVQHLRNHNIRLSQQTENLKRLNAELHLTNNKLAAENLHCRRALLGVREIIFGAAQVDKQQTASTQRKQSPSSSLSGAGHDTASFSNTAFSSAVPTDSGKVMNDSDALIVYTSNEAERGSDHTNGWVRRGFLTEIRCTLNEMRRCLVPFASSPNVTSCSQSISRKEVSFGATTLYSPRNPSFSASTSMVVAKSGDVEQIHSAVKSSTHTIEVQELIRDRFAPFLHQYLSEVYIPQVCRGILCQHNIVATKLMAAEEECKALKGEYNARLSKLTSKYRDVMKSYQQHLKNMKQIYLYREAAVVSRCQASVVLEASNAAENCGNGANAHHNCVDKAKRKDDPFGFYYSSAELERELSRLGDEAFPCPQTQPLADLESFKPRLPRDVIEYPDDRNVRNISTSYFYRDAENSDRTQETYAYSGASNNNVESDINKCNVSEVMHHQYRHLNVTDIPATSDPSQTSTDRGIVSGCSKHPKTEQQQYQHIDTLATADVITDPEEGFTVTVRVPAALNSTTHGRHTQAIDNDHHVVNDVSSRNHIASMRGRTALSQSRASSAHDSGCQSNRSSKLSALPDRSTSYSGQHITTRGQHALSSQLQSRRRTDRFRNGEQQQRNEAPYYSLLYDSAARNEFSGDKNEKVLQLSESQTTLQRTRNIRAAFGQQHRSSSASCHYDDGDDNGDRNGRNSVSHNTALLLSINKPNSSVFGRKSRQVNRDL